MRTCTKSIFGHGVSSEMPCTCTNSVAVMEQRQRRPRGTAKNKTALHLQIDPSAYAKIDAVAGGLGISKGRALDLLLASIEVDHTGRPAFYDGPLANQNQKELPLPQTA